MQKYAPQRLAGGAEVQRPPRRVKYVLFVMQSDTIINLDFVSVNMAWKRLKFLIRLIALSTKTNIS